MLVVDLTKVRLLTARELSNNLREELHRKRRLVSLFGTPGPTAETLHLNAVLAPGTQGGPTEAQGLSFARALVTRSERYHSSTREFPLFHCFERELHEEHGLDVHDHPWLKPLRGPEAGYPFYRLEGKEVHEVAVGPIHAGVIEPGHFRFSCLGERIHHLEIQLGYQHRGVNALLARGAAGPERLGPLVETIAGDTTIAHSTAFSRALEKLAEKSLPIEAELSRAIACELERIAMHLAGLSGVFTDIAFLPASSTYARLRTAAINASMRICGSRFGRGWLRPGAVRVSIDAARAKDLDETLAAMSHDLAIVDKLVRGSAIVAHRLKGACRISAETAREMGFVGMAARSAGVALDLRKDVPSPAYARFPLTPVVKSSGDSWARAALRLRELEESIAWIRRVLHNHSELPAASVDVTRLAPSRLALSATEGWRGEVFHAVETDGEGRVRAFHVQDPSLRNWFAVALAVRGNPISEFPICNKSFDLSYCGHDL